MQTSAQVPDAGHSGGVRLGGGEGGAPAHTGHPLLCDLVMGGQCLPGVPQHHLSSAAASNDEVA